MSSPYFCCIRILVFLSNTLLSISIILLLRLAKYHSERPVPFMASRLTSFMSLLNSLMALRISSLSLLLASAPAFATSTFSGVNTAGKLLLKAVPATEEPRLLRIVTLASCSIFLSFSILSGTIPVFLMRTRMASIRSYVLRASFNSLLSVLSLSCWFQGLTYSLNPAMPLYFALAVPPMDMMLLISSASLSLFLSQESMAIFLPESWEMVMSF